MDNYNPKEIEKKWYDYWETNRFFSPDTQDADETYTIVIPPPNVTGFLHIGHALVNTLQDVLIRWKRMLGYKTLWLPGTDHAGIATQMVVERELRSKGIEREELGQEKFVEEIWKWKEKSGNMILWQLRRLGASCDWERERFTLDEGLSRAVRKSFVDLYNEGLIYRGDYIVNWCPHDKTALSDLEVDHVDRDGTLTYLGYPLEDGSGELVVATTRPETMLGDTAVAVNPDDERYKKYIGKKIRLPLVGRIIPVIADSFVDPEFGTGAVKVTPSHDPNDFQMGKRHNLPFVDIFTVDAKINDVYKPLEGQNRFEARKNIIDLLKQENAFRKVEDHPHSIGQCQRCKTIVEPRVSTQWFCKMKEMADASLQAVKDGKLRIIPDNQEKIFFEWMTNIQDWCLSRQLWWGHRIPAWYCEDCGEIIVSEKLEISTCTKCDSTNLRQETDVLDTWYSSGLFPFSTMGWPDKTEDLKLFYPNSTLITGYDILFFWVARMIMMGIKMTGEVPFPEVFLHGLVRDANGEKMSKTKGNVIDPIDIIEKFGADAMRFTLTSLTVMGRDIKLPEQVIEGNRNFINKIWNATRFTLSHLERLGTPKALDQVTPGVFDQWILTRLDQAAFDMNRYLKDYRFNEAAKSIYSFVWHEFCDWYLEIVKPMLFGKLGEDACQSSLAVLYHVLEASLRLLHPIMPFVTEELWQNLPTTDGTIVQAPFITVEEKQLRNVTEADQLIELISVVRNIRGENNIKPNIKIDILAATQDHQLAQNIEGFKEIIFALAGVKQISVKEQIEKSEGLAGGVGKNFEVFIDLSGTIDIAQENKRLEKEKSKLLAKQDQISKKLVNEAFLAKAPDEVVQKNRDELEEITLKISKIDENLETINAIN
ncbi:valine--tRNA ligase [bacterium]|nr:valine--tRNA ligase [bacterium]